MRAFLVITLLAVLGQCRLVSQRLISTWTETAPQCIYSADRTNIIITDRGRTLDGLTVLERTSGSFRLFTDDTQQGLPLGKVVSVAPQIDAIYITDGTDSRTVLSSYSLSSNSVIRRDTLDSVMSIGALKSGSALLLSQRINGDSRLLYKEDPDADVETICSMSDLVFTDGLSERFYSIGVDGRVSARNVGTCDTLFSFAIPGYLSLSTIRPFSIDLLRGRTYIATNDGNLLCYDEVKNTLSVVLDVDTRIVAIDVDQRSGHVAITTPDKVYVQHSNDSLYTLVLNDDYVFESFQDAIFDLDRDRLLVANSLYSEWVDLNGDEPSTIASVASTPFAVLRQRDQVVVFGSGARVFSIDTQTLRLIKSRSISALEITVNSHCQNFARYKNSRLIFYDYTLSETDTVSIGNHIDAECLAFTCGMSTALFYRNDTVCVHDLKTNSCLAQLDCARLGTVRTGEIDEANRKIVITGTDGGLIVIFPSPTQEQYFHPLLRTRSLDRLRRTVPNHCNNANDIVISLSSIRSIALTTPPYSTVNSIFLQDPTAWIVGVFYSEDGGTLYVADNSSRYWCVDLEDNTMSIVDSTTLRGTLSTLDRETMSGVNTVTFAQHCLADFSSGCILSHIDDSPAATVSPSGLSLDYDGHNLVVSDLHGREIRSVKVFDYSGRLLACSSTTAPNIVSFAVDIPALPMFASVTGIDWHEVSRLPTIIR